MSKIISLDRAQRTLLAILSVFVLLNFACNGGDNPTDPGEGTELFDVAKIARWQPVAQPGTAGCELFFSY